MKEMMEVKEMELRQGLSIQEKLRILADAAKYDVACTSSGVDRKVWKDLWAIQKPVESATVFPQMADVFHF